VRRLETLRILVAEDHPLFRKGTISLLSSVPEFKVVSEAATGEEAVARAADLQPDVVLMDLQMPEVNGIEATRRILQESPSVRVLVVTLFEDEVSNIFTKLQLLTGHRRSSALGKRGWDRARKHSKLRK
jgi:DNA-binding NarL/FixJ family response regulator